MTVHSIAAMPVTVHATARGLDIARHHADMGSAASALRITVTVHLTAGNLQDYGDSALNCASAVLRGHWLRVTAFRELNALSP